MSIIHLRTLSRRMLLLPVSCIVLIVNYKPFCHTRTLTVLSLSYSSFLSSSIRYLFFFLPLFLSLSFVTLLPTCHPLHFPFFYLPPFLFLPFYFISLFIPPLSHAVTASLLHVALTAPEGATVLADTDVRT